MSVESWYVFRSKPHKEDQVESTLSATGIETYYPNVKVKPVNPRCSKIRPYFPGYMFIFADLEAIGLTTLRWLPGAVGLLQFGDIPATVPEGFITELKKRIEHINRVGGLIFDGLKSGDQIRIISGALAGYEAVFDARLSGQDRVRVLVDLLGRQVKAEIDARDIAKIRPN